MQYWVADFVDYYPPTPKLFSADRLVPASRMHYVYHVHQHGTAKFERVCKLDLEGIVAKHSYGPYVTEAQRTHGSRSITYSGWSKGCAFRERGIG
jgi:hypothetical protein